MEHEADRRKSRFLIYGIGNGDLLSDPGKVDARQADSFPVSCSREQAISTPGMGSAVLRQLDRLAAESSSRQQGACDDVALDLG